MEMVNEYESRIARSERNQKSEPKSKRMRIDSENDTVVSQGYDTL